MDVSQRNVVDDAVNAPPYSSTLNWVQAVEARSAGLSVRRMDALETLVLAKTVSGLDDACVEAVRRIIRDAAAGRMGRLKFLAFEFAHKGNGPSVGGAGFQTLVSELANLILDAPIVSVACARGHMEGADLELALACSMLIGEEDARFSFAGDPVVSVGTYSFLAQKIGFVRAERLMERGEVLDAEQMQALLLLKDVAGAGAGVGAMEQFLKRTARRHNSFYGIYRAQRIASPAVDESARAS